MKNVTSATLAIALFLTIIILGISAQAYALHKCGFSDTVMFYGERAFFAAILGKCDE